MSEVSGESTPRGDAASIVSVDLGARTYDILIGRDMLDRAGQDIRERLPESRFAILTDETVEHLHLERLQRALDSAGLKHSTVVVPPGEESKSFDELARVVDGILAARIERGDAVIALGGGVVGDLGGFAAAITRRGVRVVQIPTTLLAQVDSSVGGKTGINTPRGKNLVGAFYQPELVVADSGVLDTLPPRIFNAGYAEIAKIGLIGNADFFAWLEANWRAVVAGWPERDHAIAVACRAKADVVAQDELERGTRALLNLGHTFGHALETATGYSGRLLHGEAVAIGTVLAHELSAEMELCPPEDVDRIVRHLIDVGLPTRMGDIDGDLPPTNVLLDHIRQDKKVARGRLTFILSRGIGKAFIAHDISPDHITGFLDRKRQP